MLFKRKQNTRITLDPAFNSQETAINNIRKINGIISDQLGIGIPGKDPLEGITTEDFQFIGQSARLVFRGLPVLNRIISQPQKDALRNGYDILFEDDQYGFGDMVSERLEDLKFNDKALEWLIHSELYSRGVVMFPVLQELGAMKDRMHLQNKLYMQNIERIEDLNVVYEDRFNYMVQVSDETALGYGRIIDFWFSNGGHVHTDRFHHFIRNFDPIRQRGISTLDNIYSACEGLEVAEWTIKQLLIKYRALFVKYPKEDADSTGARYDAFKTLLQKIRDTMSSKSVAGMPNNYEVEVVQASFTGLNEAMEALYQIMSTKTGWPQSVIKGAALGELASSQEDKRSYHEFVMSEIQSGKLQGLFKFLIPMILHEREGNIFQACQQNGINPRALKWSVEFKPMSSINPVQDAQIKLIDAQRRSVEIDKMIITSDEAREEAYPEKEAMTGVGGFGGFAKEEEPFDLSEFMQKSTFLP